MAEKEKLTMKQAKEMALEIQRKADERAVKSRRKEAKQNPTPWENIIDPKPCRVVAEACCNHMGVPEVAINMIKSAKICGADVIKFQKRNPEKAVPLHVQKKPHPCPMHSFGETYLDHRKCLEFNISQHREFKKICEDIGIAYSCSVWDEDSARDIISLEPVYIKVPSCMNLNFKLLDILYNEYNKDVHISLGMSTKEERKEIWEYLWDKEDRTVVYWTTSGYPVKFNELYLLEIIELVQTYPKVGYSGHNLGIAADIAAYTLGVKWVERHFTLDRTMKGTDNAASLELPGLQKLCRDLKAVYNSLQYKLVEMTPDEKENRKKLRISSKSD